MKEYYEKIDQYAAGELPDTERQQFETALQTDPSLAKEVKLHRRLDELGAARFGHAAQDEALLQTLQQNGDLFFRKKQVTGWRKVIPLPARRALLAAASVAVLVLAWQLLTPNSLFDVYKGAYPAASTTQLGDENNELLENAGKAFNAKDYPLALDLYNRYLQSAPSDAEAQLYRGICLLETGDLAPAAAAFESLARSAPDFQTDATWFLALVHVKDKNWEKAKEALLQIPPDSNRAEKARELLKKVEGKSGR